MTCLVSMQQEPLDIETVPHHFLIAGDAAGGLRIWRSSSSSSSSSSIGNQSLDFVHHGLYQIRPNGEASGCAVVCLEVLPDGCLAVSTQATDAALPLIDAEPISVSTPRAVHILRIPSLMSDDDADAAVTVQSTLTGHSQKDAVICMCALPNGDLLTGGGKLDATLQLWSREQLQQGSLEEHDTACQTLSDVGYVFALTVLHDIKENSNWRARAHFYAVAAARCNTVKIIV